MKRFLILSILIVFVTVSCAGPNIVGWTKPDFRQDQFEKDRKECIDSIDKNLNSEAFGKALEECMSKKDYQYQTAQNGAKRTGPSVYGQTRWVISQDRFEKDLKECTEPIDKDPNSDAFGALKECLAKKGYEYQVPQDKESPSAGKIAFVAAGVIVLIPLIAALGAAYIVLTVASKAH